MTITDIDSVPLPSTERIRTVSGNPFMELICEMPTYSFKSLTVFLKQLLSTTDRVTQIPAPADTGNRIFIKLP